MNETKTKKKRKVLKLNVCSSKKKLKKRRGKQIKCKTLERQRKNQRKMNATRVSGEKLWKPLACTSQSNSSSKNSNRSSDQPDSGHFVCACAHERRTMINGKAIIAPLSSAVWHLRYFSAAFSLFCSFFLCAFRFLLLPLCLFLCVVVQLFHLFLLFRTFLRFFSAHCYTQSSDEHNKKARI